MDTIKAFVGIDVSKKKLDIALLRNSQVKPKAIPNTAAGFEQLEKWLVFQKVDLALVWICFEATGPYSDSLATWLDDHGFRVSVVNPARIKGYAQSELVRNKTDKSDAATIARFCQSTKPEQWHAPSAQIRVLRALVDRLDELKQTRQQELNRIEAYQSQQQGRLIDGVQKHIDWLSAEIDKLQSEIDDHIDNNPELKKDADLIQTIPGMGSISTAKFMAYVGDISRFDNAKALAAFAGVTPRNRRSGTSVRGRAMISRMGNAQLRTALYMPGLVARRHNPTLKVFADRLSERGMKNKAVIGAVSRKLVHIIFGVIKSGVPFDPKLGQVPLASQDGI